MPAGWDLETLEWAAKVMSWPAAVIRQLRGPNDVHRDWSETIYSEMTGLVWC